MAYLTVNYSSEHITSPISAYIPGSASSEIYSGTAYYVPGGYGVDLSPSVDTGYTLQFSPSLESIGWTYDSTTDHISGPMSSNVTLEITAVQSVSRSLTITFPTDKIMNVSVYVGTTPVTIESGVAISVPDGAHVDLNYNFMGPFGNVVTNVTEYSGWHEEPASSSSPSGRMYGTMSEDMNVTMTVNIPSYAVSFSFDSNIVSGYYDDHSCPMMTTLEPNVTYNMPQQSEVTVTLDYDPEYTISTNLTDFGLTKDISFPGYSSYRGTFNKAGTVVITTAEPVHAISFLFDSSDISLILQDQTTGGEDINVVSGTTYNVSRSDTYQVKYSLATAYTEITSTNITEYGLTQDTFGQYGTYSGTFNNSGNIYFYTSSPTTHQITFSFNSSDFPSVSVRVNSVETQVSSGDTVTVPETGTTTVIVQHGTGTVTTNATTDFGMSITSSTSTEKKYAGTIMTDGTMTFTLSPPTHSVTFVFDEDYIDSITVNSTTLKNSGQTMIIPESTFVIMYVNTVGIRNGVTIDDTHGLTKSSEKVYQGYFSTDGTMNITTYALTYNISFSYDSTYFADMYFNGGYYKSGETASAKEDEYVNFIYTLNQPYNYKGSSTSNATEFGLVKDSGGSNTYTGHITKSGMITCTYTMPEQLTLTFSLGDTSNIYDATLTYPDWSGYEASQDVLTTPEFKYIKGEQIDVTLRINYRDEIGSREPPYHYTKVTSTNLSTYATNISITPDPEALWTKEMTPMSIVTCKLNGTQEGTVTITPTTKYGWSFVMQKSQSVGTEPTVITTEGYTVPYYVEYADLEYVFTSTMTDPIVCNYTLNEGQSVITIQSGSETVVHDAVNHKFTVSDMNDGSIDVEINYGDNHTITFRPTDCYLTLTGGVIGGSSVTVSPGQEYVLSYVYYPPNAYISSMYAGSNTEYGYKTKMHEWDADNYEYSSKSEEVPSYWYVGDLKLPNEDTVFTASGARYYTLTLGTLEHVDKYKYNGTVTTDTSFDIDLLTNAVLLFMFDKEYVWTGIQTVPSGFAFRTTSVPNQVELYGTPVEDCSVNISSTERPRNCSIKQEGNWYDARGYIKALDENSEMKWIPTCEIYRKVDGVWKKSQ